MILEKDINMENMVKNMIRNMERMERAVTSLIFCAMMIVVTAQIIMRYILNRPLLWSEEFARYVYVWLVFIGAAYCVTQNKHVAVTLVTDRLPVSVQKALKITCNLLVAAALIYMLPHSIRYAGKQSSLLSGCMQIPMSCVFAAIPAGYMLIAAHMLLQTILILVTKPGKESGGS